jgi:hypothetical protein
MASRYHMHLLINGWIMSIYKVRDQSSKVSYNMPLGYQNPLLLLGATGRITAPSVAIFLTPEV